MEELLNKTESTVYWGTSIFAELTFRFAINLVIMLLLVRVLYYSRYKNKDFVFTFFLFNIVNLLICFLLSATQLKMGFAFGLFAIFSIIRYRTVTIPVREMGYFFVCVALGLLNALTPLSNNGLLMILANAMMLGMTVVLERGLNMKHENLKYIIYEKIELIVPERREELYADLYQRLGLRVHRIEVQQVDFMRDIAHINIFYLSDHNETSINVYSKKDNDD